MSAGPHQQPLHLQAAYARISHELSRDPNRPMSFSSAAQQEFEKRHAAYLAELGELAARSARRGGFTTVDSNHIARAAEALDSPSSKEGVSTVCNSIGGVAAGVGAAVGYEILFGPGAAHGTAEVGIAILASLAGIVLLTIGTLLAILGVRRS